jgi:hypothetical protein
VSSHLACFWDKSVTKFFPTWPWTWSSYLHLLNNWALFLSRGTGVWIQGLYLKQLHQPFLCGFFQDWVSWTIFLAGFKPWFSDLCLLRS